MMCFSISFRYSGRRRNIGQSNMNCCLLPHFKVSFLIFKFLDTLGEKFIVGRESFTIEGEEPKSVVYKKHGVRLSVSEGTLNMADTSEMTVTALIGGSFKFPKESEPISAAYVINISNSLLKPVKVDIQHCANVLTQEHINYLSFATAPIQHPCQFQLEEGGLFSLDHHYGSIYLSTSSIIIIVKSLKLNAESKLQDQDRSNEMYLPTLQSNYFVSKLTYFSKSATFDEGIIEYPVDSSKNKKILSKNSVEGKHNSIFSSLCIVIIKTSFAA